MDAPEVADRQQAVADLMAQLDDVAELPVGEQLERLDRAQQVLSSILERPTGSS